MGTQWITPFRDSLQQFLASLSKILPHLIGAVIILLIGFISAWVLHLWIAGLVRGLNHLIQRRAHVKGIRVTGFSEQAPQLLSRLVFWLVFLFFLVIALEHLGQSIVSEWLHTLAEYFPHVLAALLFVFVGVIAGNMVKAGIERLAKTSAMTHGELLGQLGRFTILGTALLIAVDQLGIDIKLIVIIIAIATSALSGAMALSFALGAKTTVSNIIASHYIMKDYKIGQVVRLLDTEGRILAITLTSVALETKEGRLLIPSHRFSHESVLIIETER